MLHYKNQSKGVARVGGISVMHPLDTVFWPWEIAPPPPNLQPREDLAGRCVQQYVGTVRDLKDSPRLREAAPKGPVGVKGTGRENRTSLSFRASSPHSQANALVTFITGHFSAGLRLALPDCPIARSPAAASRPQATQKNVHKAATQPHSCGLSPVYRPVLAFFPARLGQRPHKRLAVPLLGERPL